MSISRTELGPGSLANFANLVFGSEGAPTAENTCDRVAGATCLTRKVVRH